MNITANAKPAGLSRTQAAVKRTFDLVAAIGGLLVLGWLLVPAWIIATIDTRANGLFTQQRIGKDGRPFHIIKLRTMRTISGVQTTVTTGRDPRITTWGKIFRKTKIDELPQLINIIKGDMSFVGPRPDVPGFADQLQGDDRQILSIRPGITGPASLKYRNEEQLLAEQEDPETYNRQVIWPDKVRLNLEYLRHWSLPGDLRYILRTVFS